MVNHRDNNKTKLIEDDYVNSYSRDFDHSIYNEHKEKLLNAINSMVNAESNWRKMKLCQVDYSNKI